MKQMRGIRFNMKTSIIALVVIGVFWAIVLYAQAKTAIPADLRETTEETR